MAGEKERLHWLPVHVNDLTSDEKVLAMTTQEFGAYFLLLCAAWKSEPACSIPQDDEVLARLARLSPREWAKAKARVLAPWKSNEDGRLYQKKLLEVHADVLAKIDQKKQAGRRGGQAKAANNTKHTSPEISSGARAVLEQRYRFASSEQGSETLAKSYQPLTINQSVSNETHNADSSEVEKPPSKPAAVFVSEKITPPLPDETVLTFSCVGKTTCWHLVGPQIDAWQAIYPDLDVCAECRKAWAWIDASSKRRKTANGMMTFLVSWLNRATNSLGSTQSTKQASDLFSGQQSWIERKRRNAEASAE